MYSMRQSIEKAIAAMEAAKEQPQRFVKERGIAGGVTPVTLMGSYKSEAYPSHLGL